MRERGQHDLGLLPGSIVDLDQLDPVDPFAGGRVGSREGDGRGRMSAQEAEQLVADVPRRPEHADRDGCMIIHLGGKLCRSKG